MFDFPNNQPARSCPSLCISPSAEPIPLLSQALSRSTPALRSLTPLDALRTRTPAIPSKALGQGQEHAATAGVMPKNYVEYTTKIDQSRCLYCDKSIACDMFCANGGKCRRQYMMTDYRSHPHYRNQQKRKAANIGSLPCQSPEQPQPQQPEEPQLSPPVQQTRLSDCSNSELVLDIGDDDGGGAGSDGSEDNCDFKISDALRFQQELSPNHSYEADFESLSCIFK